MINSLYSVWPHIQDQYPCNYSLAFEMLCDLRRFFTFFWKNKCSLFVFLVSYKINNKKRKKAANKSVVKSTGQSFARLCCLLQSAVLPLILQPRSWSDVHFHTGQRVYVQHMLSLLHCKHALAVAKATV